ncbi:COX5B-domain-containing protein [Auricularia subglabra TFB-10046 SS5]|uniref:COX5B-domain-containing protein n=1 Tax=Auricularia subglabra (strain TFB-10046 / SS5) TaxID=717982 RepID=J0WVN1_AURST|nr:COX5B-domain-containing protein [Auricularia subglabra TFB-10046 SS5]
MLRLATRAAPVRALLASRPRMQVARALSVTARAASDHAAEPIVVGKGAPAGEVPTSQQQATGLERLQLVGEMEGQEFFDMDPLYIDRIGTLKDPILVKSYGYRERLVGCTGFPVESHETIWLNCDDKRTHRCPECGCAFKLDVGTPRVEHHH